LLFATQPQQGYAPLQYRTTQEAHLSLQATPAETGPIFKIHFHPNCP
jgi:hypothetical protein